MAGLLDFPTLLVEDEASIRARLDADANAGIDVTSSAFLDTTQGSVWFDFSQGVLLELARLWDFISSELPASMFPSATFGPYLDLWGQTLNLPRKAAVAATGTISFAGTPGTPIASGTQVSTEQTDPDATPETFQTTSSGTIPMGGRLDLPVEARVAGSAGNVAASTVTLLRSPLGGVNSVLNTAAMSGGAEIESDDLYSQRIMLEFSSPPGAGNISDYIRWALAYPPVGHATVEPLWAGPGTVRVMVTDQANQPVSSTVVDGLQAVLDPVSGLGEGKAPIGATVTVGTPAAVAVTVSATVTYLAGYSADGAGGTIALQGPIDAAIQQYIGNLGSGDDVILLHVSARFFTVDGVLNIATLHLNGSASDVSVPSTSVAQYEAPATLS